MGIIRTVISSEQQIRVVDHTQRTIALAGRQFGIELPLIPVVFNLTGRAAGMYRVRGAYREIRYNPEIFAKYFSDNIANTVPHEVAHYVTDVIYGLRKVKPHGREWKNVMHALGAAPEVTCRYDLSGIRQRRQKRFSYRCDCTQHELSSVRHNRASSGRARYFCRRCGHLLTPGVNAA